MKLDFVEGYYNRGSAYLNKGDYDHAIEDFAKVIHLKPDYAPAYTKRGLVYCVKGNFDHAAADFTKMIEFKPDAETYCYRGMVWLHLRKWESAIIDLITAKGKGHRYYCYVS